MAAVGAKLSHQDCKDLEKYLRYLVYKSVQVIVQSRQGDKINLPSKQFATGVDWFSLTIRDSADVLSEVKRVYPGTSGGLASGSTLCVETVLRVANGDAVQLETWYLKMAPQADSSAKISFTVYSRIGTLLKSLMLITRSIPVYRLSRQYSDNSSNCSICYRVYVGDPVFDLGAFYRNQIVGLVPTPIGTVSLSVAYRTQLSFSTSHHDGTCLEVREDHFCFEQKIVSNSIHIPCRHSTTACQQDDADLTSEHSLPLVSPSTPESKRESPTPALISTNQLGTGCSIETRNETYNSQTPESRMVYKLKTDVGIPTVSACSEFIPNTDSLNESTKQMTNAVEGHVATTAQHSTNQIQEGRNTAVAYNDFVVVDHKQQLEPKSNLEVEGDLGKFYRECRSAPALSMFQQPPGNLRDMLSTISDQLAQFEANAKEFDEFVNSFPDC